MTLSWILQKRLSMFEMKKNEFFIQDMMLIDFMFSPERFGMSSLE